MAFDRAAAKAAGYSDKEIDDYIRANPDVVNEPKELSDKELVDSLPAPSTVVPEIGRGAETAAILAGGGADLAGKAIDVAKYAVPGYYGYKAVAPVAQALAQRVSGAAVPSVSPSGVQMTGVGSPGNPIGGAAVPEGAAASEGMAARGAQVAGRAAAPGVGSMALPLAAFSAPYLMAAQEQAKIRQNPNAPGLENNPYAMVQRGEAATQGQAGAMNARKAVANMPTGYTPTPQEAQNILASGDERMINLYGGRLRLQGLASPGPNAINSGYAQQLNRLGR